MSRLDQLRTTAPAIYDETKAAFGAQAETTYAFHEARRAHAVSASAAAEMGRKLLTIVCNNPDIPMLERAGWSTAVHDSSASMSIESLAAKADECHARLSAIDEALREPGAPILAINPGVAGDRRRRSSSVQPIMRYAIARSDGSGLKMHQAITGSEGSYYHWVAAHEEVRSNGRSIYQGFNDHTTQSELLISDTSTNTLLAACVDPAEAAGRIRSGSESNVNNDQVYVIGETAITALFESIRYPDPNFIMLRGALAFAGVEL